MEVSSGVHGVVLAVRGAYGSAPLPMWNHSKTAARSFRHETAKNQDRSVFDPCKQIYGVTLSIQSEHEFTKLAGKSAGSALAP